jgi:hypothetical protein
MSNVDLPGLPDGSAPTGPVQNPPMGRSLSPSARVDSRDLGRDAAAEHLAEHRRLSGFENPGAKTDEQ